MGGLVRFSGSVWLVLVFGLLCCLVVAGFLWFWVWVFAFCLRDCSELVAGVWLVF